MKPDYCPERGNWGVCLPVLHECCMVSDEECERMRKLYAEERKRENETTETEH